MVILQGLDKKSAAAVWLYYTALLLPKLPGIGYNTQFAHFNPLDAMVHITTSMVFVDQPWHTRPAIGTWLPLVSAYRAMSEAWPNRLPVIFILTGNNAFEHYVLQSVKE